MDSLAATSESRLRPFAALQFRDFRLLWFGLVIASTTQPLQFFVQTWLIITRADPDVRLLLLGVLGAIRGGAMIAFGMFGGALADRIDRRYLLLVTQSASLALSAIISVVIISDPLEGSSMLTLLLFLFFLQSAVQAVDMPTRQSLIPQLVDRKHLPQAIALSAMAMQISAPISLFLAGTLIDLIGLGPSYLVSTLGYLVVVAAVLALRSAGGRADVRRVSLLHNVRDGVAYARHDQAILGIVIVMYVINTFGMPVMVAMAPAWFSQVLGLSASGWSRIAVFWGIGAITASLILASLGKRRYQGLTFFATATAFGLAIFGFGMVRWLPAVAFFHGSVGALVVINQVSANTLVQTMVPNQYMGRVMSLLLLGQGISQINALTVGAISQVIGLEPTVPMMGALTATFALTLALALPRVRRIDQAIQPVEPVNAG